MSLSTAVSTVDAPPDISSMSSRFPSISVRFASSRRWRLSP
uniref:Uncharacterized protein n=1 Tax=Arundo donax TaxID=35708 RepID=A0A0A8ZJ38_ARUDO